MLQYGHMFGRKPSINTSSEKIHDLLTRGVEDIIVRESLEKKLKSGNQLRIKLGFDPTSRNVHIGRAITLRKLKAFQDLGHKVVFIVGDFTAQIGDASDKLEKRPMLTEAKVRENLQNYKKVIGKIVDLSKAEFHFNSSWLAKLTFKEICLLAETFSVQQMTSRRNFKDRIDKGEEISLREFMYPLMQGYDSVMVKADVELGGFDQLFNLKAGRTIQKYYGQPEQDVVTTSMLEGTDGRKMSSSWGNVINITDEPNDMFGKVMAVRDDLITKYFLLCTDRSTEEIAQFEKDLASGTNPRDIKIELATDITALYHSPERAQSAKDSFIKTFSQGGLPDVIEIALVKSGTKLVDVFLKHELIASKTEWRRLITESAVSKPETDQKITDQFAEATAGVYKIGKRRFLDIRIADKK